MGPMIRKEMKYNMHYGDVQEDVLVLPLPKSAGLSNKSLLIRHWYIKARKEASITNEFALFSW